MSILIVHLALLLLIDQSQGSPVSAALLTPIDLAAHSLVKRRGMIPTSAVVVAPLPAPLCATKGECNVQITRHTFAMGGKWTPGLSWYVSGQVVFVKTDIEGVQFKNLAL